MERRGARACLALDAEGRAAQVVGPLAAQGVRAQLRHLQGREVLTSRPGDRQHLRARSCNFD